MNLLQPYQGKYKSAESAASYIDIVAINKGCDMIDAAATDFITVGKTVAAASEDCGTDTLSIDGKNILSTIENCANKIANTEKEIFKITSQIREQAINQYNNKQQELNNEAQSIENDMRRNEENQGK